jgi:hypothetical protein
LKLVKIKNIMAGVGSALSLNASLKTCKVEQGYAPRIQSDRFENPELMVCPVWSGFDNTNRAVCMDSYYTKSPGCNSPLDRVDVENYLRPNYMEYINLDAMGFRQGDIEMAKNSGGMSCRDPNTNMSCNASGIRTINMDNLDKITGNFGMSPSGADLQFRCPNYTAEQAQKQRQMESLQHGMQAHNSRKMSGN